MKYFEIILHTVAFKVTEILREINFLWDLAHLLKNSVWSFHNPWKLISHKKLNNKYFGATQKYFVKTKFKVFFPGSLPFARLETWQWRVQKICVLLARHRLENKCYLDKSGVSEMFLVPFVFTVSSFISVARNEFYKNDNLLDFICQIGHFIAKTISQCGNYLVIFLLLRFYVKWNLGILRSAKSAI